MKSNTGYQIKPLTIHRRLAADAATVAKEQNAFHCLIEIDITEPRRIIKRYKEKTKETLSFTAYIITCLVQAVDQNRYLNSFCKGRKLIILDDVNINTFIERDINGEKIPESIVISSAQTKTYKQIHDELRLAQNQRKDYLNLNRANWALYIPGFIRRIIIRRVMHNISMMKHYGVISVSAVGKSVTDAAWFIPLGGATVLVTIGNIFKKPALIEEKTELREYVCLTVSFNHNIVDGANAARFTGCLSTLVKSGTLLNDFII